MPGMQGAALGLGVHDLGLTAMWRPDPGVRTVDVPLADLYVGGFATLELPGEIAAHFHHGAPAIAWAYGLPLDGPRPTRTLKELPVPAPYQALVELLASALAAAHPDIAFEPPFLRATRVVLGRHTGGEHNQWHYDAKDGPPDRYRRDEREQPRRGFVSVTLAAPIDVQPPSVYRPYGGPYEGMAVQGRAGTVTFGLPRSTWHRADGRPRNRILIRVSFWPADGLHDIDAIYSHD